MIVFELLSDSDRFQWLDMAVGENFNVLGLLEGETIRGVWRAPRVEPLIDKGMPGPPTGDFPTLGGSTPVFSKRAAIALGDRLEQHGELLPLVSTEGEFFVYNVTTVIDALDEARSELLRFRSSGRVMQINRFSFYPERLLGAEIFKIPQMRRGPTLVTNAFVDAVARTDLVGFRFRTLWSDDAAAPDRERNEAG